MPRPPDPASSHRAQPSRAIDLGNVGGGTKQPHELATFMREAANTMAEEYERIRRRAASDPGTAGDEEENNWRGLLEQWLPPELAVVTKGRILGHKGDLSPQVDVLVLRPGYPPALRDKKTYLAGAVLAAFECKLTLRKHHIAEAATTARAIRNLVSPRNGTPYGELHSPIIFGLLAHATALRRDPERQIDEALAGALRGDSHPREAIDAICIANLAFWYGGRHVMPPMTGLPDEFLERLAQTSGRPAEGSVENYYFRWHDSQGEHANPGPVYLLFERLIRRIAYEVELYRPVADYWAQASVGGARSVAGRRWPIGILTKPSAEGIAQGKWSHGGPWSPWYWGS